VTVGLPFIAVACTAPLLQSWFTITNHDSARDPYFLYAANNVGSLVALLAYPLVLERWLTLTEQSWLWTAGYYALMVLIACCSILTLRQPKPTLALPVSSDCKTSASATSPWRWVL